MASGLSAPAIEGTAEKIPLEDGSADAVMAVLSDQHWRDREIGLGEMLRIARRRVVALTFDERPREQFWLPRDYLTEYASLRSGRTSSRALVSAGRVEGAARCRPAPTRLQCQRQSDRRPPPRGLHPSESRKRARAWRHRRAASPGAYAGSLLPLIGRAPPAGQGPARGASASARDPSPERDRPPPDASSRRVREAYEPLAFRRLEQLDQVANRRPPACWATLICSTDAALPHGVVIGVFI